MKRLGYQIEKVAELGNLQLAFWKAQRGKSGKKEVLAFRQNLDAALRPIQEELLTAQLKVGDYHYFRIYDPKERQICAASFRERVIHHALMNVCHPHFEQRQIYHSYATRLTKGTYKAVRQAKVNTKRFRWYLKMDMRKYFDSIDHILLKKQLFSMYKDERLLKCLYQIIDSYETGEGKGVPIGNLTSQYFANHYLSLADHYALKQLNAPAYVRYMDDVVIWHWDKELLKAIRTSFEAFLSEQLALSLKPPAINRTQYGLPFLGYLIYKDRILLACRSKKRYITKTTQYYKNLAHGQWSAADFQRHMLPLTAFVAHADSLGFRNRILSRLEGR